MVTVLNPVCPKWSQRMGLRVHSRLSTSCEALALAAEEAQVAPRLADGARRARAQSSSFVGRAWGGARRRGGLLSKGPVSQKYAACSRLSQGAAHPCFSPRVFIVLPSGQSSLAALFLLTLPSRKYAFCPDDSGANSFLLGKPDHKGSNPKLLAKQ